MGIVPLSATGADLLFEVFRQHYERGSILVSTNLPFDEWTEVFGAGIPRPIFKDLLRSDQEQMPDGTQVISTSVRTIVK